ncbi:hypothetical protein VTJ49DRAFT_1936 [Mycothermus thermophilus]|uniref:SH3 domain-containing protein n=1 Tax=Humicola insolens TaxID=85995 RepID=A0ABR3VCC4_HUMIN
MARPLMIRADTFDLEANEESAAKRKPTPDGSIAPHQAETLRKVAAETAEDIRRSTGTSWNPDSLASVHQDAPDSDPAPGRQTNGTTAAGTMRLTNQHDALAVAQNGGLSGHEVEDGEMDAADPDVDLDDDLMDKISSSPSIEDGGSIFALPLMPSTRAPFLPPSAAPGSPPASSDVGYARSSSPYLESPEYLPLERGQVVKDQRGVAPSSFLSSARRHHHHPDDFAAEDNTSSEPDSFPVDPVPDDILPQTNEDHKPNQLDLSNSPGIVKETVDPESERGDDHEERDEGSIYDLTVPFIDSGWGGECLQDTEDIDFDFVYALHTFVATVEGQANATKGDTMVLLDDSNSYWWLVRVVKDSSIGYLPAEHIETPTERLARLNKHRNIDLSASMLGDQPDKARNNGLMSAMKRRKAKTVQFAAPTYVDYSDIDYSTDEDDADAQIFAQAQQQQQQAQQEQQEQQAASDVEMEDETAKVEPLRPRSQKQATADKRQEATGEINASSNSSSTSAGASDSSGKSNKSGARVVGEVTEGKANGPKKTSDGTVRDSFFKDDTVETKKITLTPNLLRDDNDERTSTDRDVKQRPSLDKLDKDGFFSKDDKKKKKDKEKDKKQGGLRGFFSRKDKKAKGDEDDESFGKRSMDADAPDKDGEEDESLGTVDKPGPQRNPSKLQKHYPRTEPSPTRRSNSTRDNGTRENGVDIKGFLADSRVSNVANVPPASMRLVPESPNASPASNARDLARNRDPSPGKSTPSKAPRAEPRPAQVMAARSRMDLDDFDSDDDIVSEPTRPATGPEEGRSQPQQQQQASQTPAPASEAPAQQTAPSSRSGPTATTNERLSESPVHVSPVQNPPPLVADHSSQDGEDRVSALSTPSPELIDRDEAGEAQQQQSGGSSRKVDQAATTSSTTAGASPPPQPQPEVWDDASLRAFFDSGSDVRDLLVVVYDKNDVDDIGADHPVARSLFMEQNAKLAEIATRLDDMLGDWLARKQRLRGTV